MTDQQAATDLIRFRAGDLHAIRRIVGDHATAAGADPERTADIVLAVNEAVTNAIEHGGGAGTVWFRARETPLVIEVSDSGAGYVEPSAGTAAPAPTSRRGRGIWLIRQLSEQVEIRSGIRGTIVRMHLPVIP